MALTNAEKTTNKTIQPFSVLQEVDGDWVRDNNFSRFLATLSARTRLAIQNNESSIVLEGDEYLIEEFSTRSGKRLGVQLTIESELPYSIRETISIPGGKRGERLVRSKKQISLRLLVLPNDPIPGPDNAVKPANADLRLQVQFARPIISRWVQGALGPYKELSPGRPLEFAGKAGYGKDNSSPYALFFSIEERSRQLLLVKLMNDGLVIGSDLIDNNFLSKETIEIFVADGVVTKEQAYGAVEEPVS